MLIFIFLLHYLFSYYLITIIRFIMVIHTAMIKPLFAANIEVTAVIS